MKDVFCTLRNHWLNTAELCAKRKHKDFGIFAEQCYKFYASENHNFLYSEQGQFAEEGWGLSANAPKVTINKSFECVDVFVPFMHHRNPTRIGQPRRPKVPPELRLALVPPEVIQGVSQQMMMQRVQSMQQAQMQGQMIDPMMAQQAMQPPGPQEIAAALFPPDPKEAIEQIRKILLEGYLNYTPQELELKRESFQMLTEALVAGRGVMWTEVLPTVRGNMIGTFRCPISDFFVDPDHYEPRNWGFVIRRRRVTKWELAERFKIPVEKIKATGTSAGAEARFRTLRGINPDKVDSEHTQDLVTYYEIYSRIGIGTRLAGADETLDSQFETLGGNVYLCVSDSYEYPLNLDPSYLDIPVESERAEARKMLMDQVQWPLPFHRDSVWPWPFALCDFHHQSESAWPVSHLRPALGEQKMLNWIWSFVADRIKRSGHGRWLYNRDADPESIDKLQQAVNELWVPVRLREGEKLADVALFMQSPEMNKDLWEAAMAFERMFEQRTGVSELLTTGATSRQMRSAAEAHIRERFSQNRPEAMADTYDDCQSRVARNEAVAARLMVDAQSASAFFSEPLDESTVPPTIGPYTEMWMQTVFTADPDEALAETDIRIESGSMRKPNSQEIATALVEAGQMLVPSFQQQAMGGMPGNYQTWLDAYSKANHLPNFDANFPMPVAPPQEGGGKEKQAA